MKKQNSKPEEASSLRQKAEEKLKFRRDVAHNVSTEPDLLKLIHELEVHQIELEMQNEELVIAKEKAELAEEKYTELYDFAPSGYIALSKKGEILELNFAAANMLGKERTKLIKKRFDFLVSICTQATFNQFLQDIFIGKIKQSCEAIIEPEGKLPIYVNIEGVISKNDEFCLLTLRDVTEKNRAQKELQSSEEKYRISEFDLKKAQQIAHLGNWMLNIETNELFWSDEIYRIFGCEPQAFESTYEAFLGFIHPDDRERVNSAYLKSLDTKTEYQIEHRIITKNNQLKYVKQKCTTTFNEQGKPLNSFGIVIDITDQKALENELIQAKEKAEDSEAKQRSLSEHIKQERILLRTIIDSIPDSIYAKDIECRKILSNEANFQSIGFDKEEDIIGKTDFDMYPVNIADKFFEDDQKVFKQGISLINREECYNKANGDIKWSLTSKLPLYNDAGKIVGLVGIGRDITEHKKAEEALLAKVDELERFFKITVGREITMVELKKEVNNLLNKLGQDNKYTINE